jgi:hypothetical protein
MTDKVGYGGRNTTPTAETLPYLAGEDISRGELVYVSATDGITVSLCPSTHRPVGVADADIASGAVGEIIVKGFCGYMITDGTVAADQVLVASSTDGAADGVALATTNTAGTFGVALAADVSTVLSAAIIY